MKKHLKYLLFFLIVILSAIVFSNAFFATEKNYIKTALPEATDTFDYTDSYVLRQTIAAEDNFCGITIKLIPPVSKSKTLTVSILSPDGEELVSKTFDSRNDYSAPFNVTFSSFFGENEELYTVEIRSDGIDAPAPLYYIGGEKTATVNDRYTDCSLSVSPIYSNRVAIVLFFTFLIGISVLILAVYILINSLALGRENAFVVSICAFLVLGMLIIPLGAGIQETSAFPAAYAMSDGELFSSPSGGGNESSPVFSLPDGFEALLSGTPDYTSTVSILRNGADNGERIFIPARSTDKLSALSFAPASLGITLAGLFTDNPAFIFYFARMFSVLFAVVLLFITIKILPWGKRVFFVICLNPAVISLLCTVSSFGIPLLLSFLLFALVMNIKNSDDTVSTGKLISLTVISLLTALSSIITLPMVLLSLIILGRKRFSSVTSYVFALVGMLVLPLALGIARIAVFCTADPFSIKFASLITSDHDSFFRNFFYELKETSSETMLSIFGKRVTSDGTVISGGLSSLVIMFLTFIAAVLDRNLKDKFSRKAKVILLTCGALAGIFALGGEYIGSGLDLLSPAGILGCYFIPMLLPLLFALGDNGVKYNTDSNSRRLRDCVYSIGMFPFAFYMLSTVIHYI
ncbi:MAG: DUF2142 domain-containing protein [Clostridia bacterium]|nr:DUF2142 domain-containing protein [Clostridia bacterium]